MTPTGIWKASGEPTSEQVDWAKPILAAALEGGRKEAWVGATYWHWTPLPPERLMPCGHPLAARKISVIKAERFGKFSGDLETTCWACEVQAEAR